MARRVVAGEERDGLPSWSMAWTSVAGEDNWVGGRLGNGAAAQPHFLENGMPWSLAKPVLDRQMVALCRRPYPNHPKGCPNWGKKDGCPPKAKALGDLIDLSKDVWVIWTKFNLYDHTTRMNAKHPNWSVRQLNCCLYWQTTARKALRKEVEKFEIEVPRMEVVMSPEACGVNVTSTMQLIGQRLQWPPKDWAYQVVIAGSRK